jgi:hypothetical protein
MPVVGRFIAIFVATLHLAAAFLPCEPPSSLTTRTRTAGTAHRASTTADPAPVDEHAHHKIAEHVGPSDEHVRASAHPQEEAHSDDSGLEFNPTCLCGCRETGALIAGNTSQLGSVILPTVVAHRIEPATRLPAAYRPDRDLEFFSDIDPIPI